VRPPPPWFARTQHVVHAIAQLATGVFGRTPARLRRGHEGLQDYPLAIGQIGRIGATGMARLRTMARDQIVTKRHYSATMKPMKARILCYWCRVRDSRVSVLSSNV
jgi:hypothetical protein